MVRISTSKCAHADHFFEECEWVWAGIRQGAIDKAIGLCQGWTWKSESFAGSRSMDIRTLPRNTRNGGYRRWVIVALKERETVTEAFKSLSTTIWPVEGAKRQCELMYRKNRNSVWKLSEVMWWFLQFFSIQRLTYLRDWGGNMWGDVTIRIVV
jgi:hypothetical protein